MLQSRVPASLAVTDDDLSLEELLADLAHVPGLEFQHGPSSVVVVGIRPADLLTCLQAVVCPSLQVSRLPAQPRLAHTVTDRLSAWEHSC